MTRDEFEQMAILSSFFPLTFVTGRQMFTRLTIVCNSCSRVIPDDRLHGSIAPVQDGYRSVIHAYQVEASGLCPTCDMLTHGSYTLRDDMTVTDIHVVTGDAVTYGMRTLTWTERIRAYLKKLLHRD